MPVSPAAAAKAAAGASQSGPPSPPPPPTSCQKAASAACGAATTPGQRADASAANAAKRAKSVARAAKKRAANLPAADRAKAEDSAHRMRCGDRSVIVDARALEARSAELATASADATGGGTAAAEDVAPAVGAGRPRISVLVATTRWDR